MNIPFKAEMGSMSFTFFLTARCAMAPFSEQLAIIKPTVMPSVFCSQTSCLYVAA
jgi:hypothetical protein